MRVLKYYTAIPLYAFIILALHFWECSAISEHRMTLRVGTASDSALANKQSTAKFAEQMTQLHLMTGQ